MTTVWVAEEFDLRQTTPSRSEFERVLHYRERAVWSKGRGTQQGVALLQPLVEFPPALTLHSGPPVLSRVPEHEISGLKVQRLGT